MRVSATSFLVAFLVGALVGCTAEHREGGAAPDLPAPSDVTATAEETARLDEHLYLGAPVTVGNLTAWPVHTDAALDVGDFLTLREAQDAGEASVREVAAGEVSRIIVEVRAFLAEQLS